MTFSQFLEFMTGPGINAAIGFAMSFGIEEWATWQNLDARAKRLAMFGLCMLVPLVFTLIGVLTGYLPAGFEQSWWPALVAGFAAFGASTVAHVRKL